MTSAEEMANKIALAMECKMRRHGREWRVLCPHHEADGGDHSPSLAIWDKPDGGSAMKCMVGCSKKEIVLALKARGVVMPKTAPLTPEQKLEQATLREQERINKITAARDLFDDSIPSPWDSPVGRYLSSRRLRDWSPHDTNEILRTADDPMYPGFPAMLVPIVDLTTLRSEPTATGVMTLSLLADGRPRFDRYGHKQRSVHGVQKGSACAFGDCHYSHLVVAEGVESALSAMKLLDISFGCATLSSSNMKPLRIPPWVTRVTIAADNDEAGQKAAEGLKKSLVKLVSCEIKTWGIRPMDSAGVIRNVIGWDANDELMRINDL